MPDHRLWIVWRDDDKIEVTRAFHHWSQFDLARFAHRAREEGGDLIQIRVGCDHVKRCVERVRDSDMSRIHAVTR